MAVKDDKTKVVTRAEADDSEPLGAGMKIVSPPADPASPFPNRPGYQTDEDTPDYAAVVDAGRKAALAEAVEQSEEVARLKREADDLHETITILRDELVAYKSANARLEAKWRIVTDIKYEYDKAHDVRMIDLNTHCKEKGWEPCHWQFDSTGLKLSVVYRKPITPEPAPAPQPEEHAGMPTHRNGDGFRIHRAPGVQPLTPDTLAGRMLIAYKRGAENYRRQFPKLDVNQPLFGANP